MKHILRSLPLGKPFCPHCLASHSSKHSLHALFTTHQIHIHGHRVAPWCVAPVRPPTLRSRPHGRPLRAARRLPARVPPSLPRSHRSFPTFTMRETERARDGRAGRKITHGAAGRRRHPLHHHMRSLGEARLGRVGGINAKTRKPTPSLPPWFHLPPRLVSPPSPLHLIYLHRAMHARHVLWKRLACMRMDTQHGSLWMLLLGASPRK